MKKQRICRAACLVLSLVMLLSAVAIPAVAEGQREYEMNFDGESLVNVSQGRPSLASIVSAKDEAHGDVLQLKVQPKANAQYYLWKNNNNKWAVENPVLSSEGLLSGKANGITFTNAVVNTEKLDASTKIDDTHYIVSGEYADAYSGAGNISTPATLKTPAFLYTDTPCVVIDLELWLSPDFKNTSGVSGRVGSTSGNVELFELKSSANGATLSAHENGVLSAGAAVELSLDTWYRLTFLIDLYSETRYVYLDGTLFSAQKNKNALATPFSLNANKLSLQIDRGAAPSTFAGSVQFDNVSMYSADRDAFAIYKNDFEGETVGAEPANGFASLGGLNGSSVKNSYGSLAWGIPVNADNVDKNPMVANPEVSYKTVSNVVYEADYFITSGTYGKLQSQLLKPTAFAADATEATTVGNGWVDLYTITMAEGKAPILALESGNSYGQAYLEVNRWNRISVAIDLVNCTKVIYLNGTAVIESAIFPGAELKNLTVRENSLILAGKINKNQAKYEGELLIDNVKLLPGFAPTMASELASKNGFDALRYFVGTEVLPNATFSSVPSLLRVKNFDGGYALHLPMRANASDSSYALLSSDGRTVLSWDFEWDPASPYVGRIGSTDYTVYWEHSLRRYCTDYNGARAYVVSDAVAETSVGARNVAAALMYRHAAFSYASTEKVMLEANYFIEEGSAGVIESQFQSYQYGEAKTTGSWIQLFTINTETGCFDGTQMHLSIGEWNNVKVIMNLASGSYDMYVNGVWAKTETVGNTNLTIGASDSAMWSVAKVQRTTNVLTQNGTGGVYIDDVWVTDQVAVSTSRISEKFLSDTALASYLDGIITMVDGASIRLGDPTGLRFASEIDAHKLSHLQNVFGAAAFVGAGTVITPAEYVAEAGGCTKMLLDKLSHSANYIDVKYDGAFFDGASVGLDGTGVYYLAGSIANIRKANVSREFAASAYITLKIADTSFELYTDNVTYRSAEEVAKKALSDKTADWSAAELAILEAYAK